MQVEFAKVQDLVANVLIQNGNINCLKVKQKMLGLGLNKSFFFLFEVELNCQHSFFSAHYLCIYYISDLMKVKTQKKII